VAATAPIPRSVAVAYAAAARRELAVQSLAEFVRQAWPILEPGTPLLWNWHIDIICDALERQARGDREYRKLLICIPPGCMKSLLVSVFAPAWRWLFNPEHRSLFLANDDDLVVRDSRKTRDVVESKWYRALLEHQARAQGLTPDDPRWSSVVWTLAHDQNEKTNFENTRRGFRQCRPIGTRITGKRGDGIVIDDPIDAKAVVNGSIEQVAARLQEVNNTIEKTLPSRVNDLATAQWTMIMQRLHVDDPAGRVIRRGGWKVINIAMEFDPEDRLNHPGDPRSEPGELMFPAKFPEVELANLRADDGLGLQQYEAQYNQHPTPSSGLKFQREWFPTYEAAPWKLAPTLDEIAITVDAAAKAGRKNDYCSLQVWGRKGARKYLLDRVCDRMEFPTLLATFRNLCAKWPAARVKLVEDKSHGTTLIQLTRDDIPGVIAYNPTQDKVSRAGYTQTAAQARQIELPTEAHLPGVSAWLEQHLAFPLALHDDDVDATSQLMERWEGELAKTPLEKVQRELGFIAQVEQVPVALDPMESLRRSLGYSG
jgi:predicted phage terminase large subunit-like protein